MTEDEIKTAMDDIQAEAEADATAVPPLQEPFKLGAVSQSQRDGVTTLIAAARASGALPDSVPDPADADIVLTIGELLHPIAVAALQFGQFGSMRLACIVVAEDYREQGIGRRLIERAMDIASERGCTRLVVDVPSECGGAAEALESLGFDQAVVRYEAAIVPEDPVETAA